MPFEVNIFYFSIPPTVYIEPGLAETLRSELLLYGIDVHIFLPPTMFSPGYEVEMRTKPEITKRIEEDDIPLTTDEAATVLFHGKFSSTFLLNCHSH